ncbi:MAG: TadE/TadG family type IV pilus assembly protein [Caulobacterales bacterium]
MSGPRETLAKALRRLRADRGGVAAVEFALIAPVLMLMYFGVAELTLAMMAQRQAAHAASSIGDLVAQSASTTQAEVTEIFAIGDAIVEPFPTTPLQMRVTSISADANGDTTVAWSQASGMAAFTKNQTISVPANIVSANQSVIRSDTSYTFTSPVSYVLPYPIAFNTTYYLHPRLSTSVSCADC